MESYMRTKLLTPEPPDAPKSQATTPQPPPPAAAHENATGVGPSIGSWREEQSEREKALRPLDSRHPERRHPRHRRRRRQATGPEGYTTEEEAEAVFTLWRMRCHARQQDIAAAEKPSRQPIPRWRIAEHPSRVGIPRADTKNIGQYLPVNRETHPDAFRPAKEVKAEGLRKAEAIAAATAEVATSEREVKRIRKERRGLWLAKQNLKDLRRVDHGIENVERMMAVSDKKKTPLPDKRKTRGSKKTAKK